MQFKPVPEPPDDRRTVESILEAVPATAGAVEDCCQHLLTETGLEARSDAETWLVFFRALELVRAEADGYRRATTDSSGDALRADHVPQSFRERVYGAESVLEVLERADGPASVAAVAAASRENGTGVHRRGADRRGRTAAGATERVRRLLEWAVMLTLSDRTDDGRYRSPTASKRRPE